MISWVIQTKGEGKCILGRGNIKKIICGREKKNSISGSGSYMMFNLDEVFGKRVKKTHTKLER